MRTLNHRWLLYLISPQSVDLLFSDPTGNMLLAYAIASVLVGHLVISWMIKGKHNYDFWS